MGRWRECVMRDVNSPDNQKGMANRRNVLKLIGGATVTGATVSSSASGHTDELPSPPSDGFSDRETEEYSGSDPQGSFWYTEYRGFMASGCVRVSKITADDGRVFHEISASCTSEYERKHRVSGWDDGFFLGGNAIKFDFPNHQVLTPQDANSQNEWIGASIDGSGDMDDSVSDEAEAVFDLLVDLAPYAYIKDFTDFWNEIAAAQEPDTEYDYKWGTDPVPTYGSEHMIQHWVKILIEEEPDDPPVSGEIEHTAFCGSLDNKSHTLNIDASSATNQNKSLKQADAETVQQKEKMLESAGHEDITIESVQVR